MFVWNASPEILSLGPITLRWYSLLFALAFILGYQVVRNRYQRESKDLRSIDSLLIHMIVGTVVGARLGHCLFYEPLYYLSRPWEILAVWQGGLASHGAVIGIFAAAYWFQKKHRDLSFWWVIDTVCLAIPLSGALIRVGNFFNSEIIGRATDLPWSVVFLRVDLTPRHPSQLYEALAYLTIFGVGQFLYRRKLPVKDGFFFGYLLAAVFGARFFLEFSKEAQVAFENSLPINMGQILSIPLIALGFGWMWRTWASTAQKENRH
jgi:prolipoprotein diacylglyceryl transferase